MMKHIACLAFVGLLFGGCSAGISAGDSGFAPGDLEFISASGTTLESPVYLWLGESFSFSVMYRGERLALADCRVMDPNGARPNDASYGWTERDGFVCTYHAPDEMPSGATGEIAYSVEADLDTSPTATAKIEVILREPAGGACITTKDCRSDEFCYYGRCMPWADAGVRTDMSCNRESDCYGMDLPACIPFDTAQGCESYCANLTSFFAPSLDPPMTKEACGQVTGAGWSEEMGLCIFADYFVCMEPEGQCNASYYVYGGCRDLSGNRELCDRSYALYFNTGGEWDVPYKYFNCRTHESGLCVANEECEDQGVHHPHNWNEFVGRYVFMTKDGEMNSEACTPRNGGPTGADLESLSVLNENRGWGSLCQIRYDEPWSFSFDYACESYNPLDGTANGSSPPYRVKVYLEDGKIKLIFLDAVNCYKDGGGGRVYEYTAD